MCTSSRFPGVPICMRENSNCCKFRNGYNFSPFLREYEHYDFYTRLPLPAKQKMPSPSFLKTSHSGYRVGSSLRSGLHEAVLWRHRCLLFQQKEHPFSSEARPQTQAEAKRNDATRNPVRAAELFRPALAPKSLPCHSLPVACQERRVRWQPEGAPLGGRQCPRPTCLPQQNGSRRTQSRYLLPIERLFNWEVSYQLRGYSER